MLSNLTPLSRARIIVRTPNISAYRRLFVKIVEMEEGDLKRLKW